MLSRSQAKGRPNPTRFEIYLAAACIGFGLSSLISTLLEFIVAPTARSYEFVLLAALLPFLAGGGVAGYLVGGVTSHSYWLEGILVGASSSILSFIVIVLFSAFFGLGDFAGGIHMISGFIAGGLIGSTLKRATKIRRSQLMASRS